MVEFDDLLDQRCRRIDTGIGGEHTLGVGEQHQQLGLDQWRHERGDAIVVAEADLVVGDRVVLVHHRHHAELEEAGQRRPGMQVLPALTEVVGGEQHLAGDEPVLAEGRVPVTEELELPDR